MPLFCQAAVVEFGDRCGSMRADAADAVISHNALYIQGRYNWYIV